MNRQSMSCLAASRGSVALYPTWGEEHKRGEELIKRDAYLYEMMPHMHFRGKYMSYSAEFPDGKPGFAVSAEIRF